MASSNMKLSACRRGKRGRTVTPQCERGAAAAEELLPASTRTPERIAEVLRRHSVAPGGGGAAAAAKSMLSEGDPEIIALFLTKVDLSRRLRHKETKRLRRAIFKAAVLALPAPRVVRATAFSLKVPADEQAKPMRARLSEAGIRTTDDGGLLCKRRLVVSGRGGNLAA